MTHAEIVSRETISAASLVYLIKSQSIEEGEMTMPRKPYLDAQARYRKLGEIDGVESRQILLQHPLGSKLWSINQLQSKLAGMRIRYKLEGSLGRANLEREAGGVKATIDRIVSSFVTDCELVADYKMTKQEFVTNWYGHYDNGYVNQYVITVDLWTGARYYEQF